MTPTAAGAALPPLPPAAFAAAEPQRRKRAVIYLRVSTAKQVHRDDDPDGYSLPAQREACDRKAESLDAEVVAVFVDRGESAKTADRREFQKMLAFVKQQGDIDYVILDKVDRFARNRRDDANIMFELKTVGTSLISVKENIDETPGGQLLHAIMAGIAEFYSRNLATEALKGMTQKAKVGGTPGRAPVGYLNTRQRIEGREVAIVIVDPERAPLIRWAFEVYATGEWTIRQLVEALAEKGLKALPHGKKIPGPLVAAHISRILRNRYYIGRVTFKGIEYEGRHEPLISEDLFHRVQEMLDLHNVAGEKRRVNNHYLKSTVYCGTCGERLSLTNAKGQYLYFYCLGRQTRRTACTQPFLAADAVEEAVVRYWQTVHLSDEMQEAIRNGVRAEIQHRRDQAGPEAARAKRRVQELADERRRLARGVVTGSIPEDLAREEQERIVTELRHAETTLRATETMYEDIEEILRLTLELVGRAGDVYRAGGPQVRRLANRFFFEQLRVSVVVNVTTVTEATLHEPMATLLDPVFQSQMIQNDANPGQDLHGVGLGGPDDTVDLDRGLRMVYLVRSEGLEPPTF